MQRLKKSQQMEVYLLMHKKRKKVFMYLFVSDLKEFHQLVNSCCLIMGMGFEVGGFTGMEF